MVPHKPPKHNQNAVIYSAVHRLDRRPSMPGPSSHHQQQLIYGQRPIVWGQQQPPPPPPHIPYLQTIIRNNNNSHYMNTSPHAMVINNRNAAQPQVANVRYPAMNGRPMMSPQMMMVRQTMDGRSTPLVLQRESHGQPSSSAHTSLQSTHSLNFRPIRQQPQDVMLVRNPRTMYESESGSEAAGEVQRIFNYREGSF